MNQVWVVGEVLIDLLPDGDKQKAVVGGGPANTAVALSKLGIKTQFINGISTDAYGSDCRQYLEDAGVSSEEIQQQASQMFGANSPQANRVKNNMRGQTTKERLQKKLADRNKEQ